MSDTKVKISELPSVSEVLGTDESPAVQSSTTKKFTMTQLGSYILGAFSGLSLGGIAQTAKAAIDTVTTALTTLSDFIGNTSMGTTATTVTGAIAEHEGDITSLNSSLNTKADVYRADWNNSLTWTVKGSQSILMVISWIIRIYTPSTTSIGITAMTDTFYSKSGVNDVVYFGATNTDQTYKLERNGQQITVTKVDGTNASFKVIT